MEKRTKLGVAATSLAAAAAMISPTTASAAECISCDPIPPGDADFVFYKIDAAFDGLFYKIRSVAPEEVSATLDEVFIKLDYLFMKE